MKENPICQSCGMPMVDNHDFGTEIDDAKSKEFCKYCYRKGRFIDEGITMEEKIEKCIIMGRIKGFPEETLREIANNIIPNLKRWKR